MKPFFSFIIPCCDVEKYIRECLDSVLGQSFQNWECLCGVETSKDKTEEIVREYCARDSRINIFTCERSGSCSATRNTGTEMAQGDYVIFLDGDDSITENSLEILHRKISERPGADLYPCAIQAYNEDTGEREIRDNYLPNSPAEMTGIEATLEIDRLWGGPFCPMLQLSVFRREFLMENDLRCIYGLRRQDSEFSPRALYLAKRVVPLHEAFYLYRIRVNSVSTGARGPGYFHKDWAIITKSLLAFYGKVSKEPGFDVRVASCWIRQWFSRFIYFWFSPENMSSIPRKQRLETLNIIFDDGFADFDSLVKYAPIHRRLMGCWVHIFVRHAALRPLSELLFRGYFFLTGLRGRRTASFRSPGAANQ